MISFEAMARMRKQQAEEDYWRHKEKDRENGRAISSSVVTSPVQLPTASTNATRFKHVKSRVFAAAARSRTGPINLQAAATVARSEETATASAAAASEESATKTTRDVSTPARPSHTRATSLTSTSPGVQSPPLSRTASAASPSAALDAAKAASALYERHPDRHPLFEAQVKARVLKGQARSVGAWGSALAGGAPKPTPASFQPRQPHVSVAHAPTASQLAKVTGKGWRSLRAEAETARYETFRETRAREDRTAFETSRAQQAFLRAKEEAMLADLMVTRDAEEEAAAAAAAAVTSGSMNGHARRTPSRHTVASPTRTTPSQSPALSRQTTPLTASHALHTSAYMNGGAIDEQFAEAADESFHSSSSAALTSTPARAVRGRDRPDRLSGGSDGAADVRSLSPRRILLQRIESRMAWNFAATREIRAALAQQRRRGAKDDLLATTAASAAASASPPPLKRPLSAATIARQLVRTAKIEAAARSSTRHQRPQSPQQSTTHHDERAADSHLATTNSDTAAPTSSSTSFDSPTTGPRTAMHASSEEHHLRQQMSALQAEAEWLQAESDRLADPAASFEDEDGGEESSRFGRASHLSDSYDEFDGVGAEYGVEYSASTRSRTSRQGLSSQSHGRHGPHARAHMSNGSATTNGNSAAAAASLASFPDDDDYAEFDGEVDMSASRSHVLYMDEYEEDLLSRQRDRLREDLTAFHATTEVENAAPSSSSSSSAATATATATAAGATRAKQRRTAMDLEMSPLQLLLEVDPDEAQPTSETDDITTPSSPPTTQADDATVDTVSTVETTVEIITDATVDATNATPQLVDTFSSPAPLSAPADSPSPSDAPLTSTITAAPAPAPPSSPSPLSSIAPAAASTPPPPSQPPSLTRPTSALRGSRAKRSTTRRSSPPRGVRFEDDDAKRAREEAEEAAHRVAEPSSSSNGTSSRHVRNPSLDEDEEAADEHDEDDDDDDNDVLDETDPYELDASDAEEADVRLESEESSTSGVVGGSSAPSKPLVFPSSHLVRISLSCQNLPISKSYGSSADTLVVVWCKEPGGTFVRVGQTEVRANTRSPVYETPLVFTHVPHARQLLRFVLYDIELPPSSEEEDGVAGGPIASTILATPPPEECRVGQVKLLLDHLVFPGAYLEDLPLTGNGRSLLTGEEVLRAGVGHERAYALQHESVEHQEHLRDATMSFIYLATSLEKDADDEDSVSVVPPVNMTPLVAPVEETPELETISVPSQEPSTSELESVQQRSSTPSSTLSLPTPPPPAMSSPFVMPPIPISDSESVSRSGDSVIIGGGAGSGDASFEPSLSFNGAAPLDSSLEPDSLVSTAPSTPPPEVRQFVDRAPSLVSLLGALDVAPSGSNTRLSPRQSVFGVFQRQPSYMASRVSEALRRSPHFKSPPPPRTPPRLDATPTPPTRTLRTASPTPTPPPTSTPRQAASLSATTREDEALVAAITVVALVDDPSREPSRRSPSPQVATTAAIKPAPTQAASPAHASSNPVASPSSSGAASRSVFTTASPSLLSGSAAHRLPAHIAYASSPREASSSTAVAATITSPTSRDSAPSSSPRLAATRPAHLRVDSAASTPDEEMRDERAQLLAMLADSARAARPGPISVPTSTAALLALPRVQQLLRGSRGAFKLSRGGLFASPRLKAVHLRLAHSCWNHAEPVRISDWTIEWTPEGSSSSNGGSSSSRDRTLSLACFNVFRGSSAAGGAFASDARVAAKFAPHDARCFSLVRDSRATATAKHLNQLRSPTGGSADTTRASLDIMCATNDECDAWVEVIKILMAARARE